MSGCLPGTLTKPPAPIRPPPDPALAVTVPAEQQSLAQRLAFLFHPPNIKALFTCKFCTLWVTREWKKYHRTQFVLADGADFPAWFDKADWTAVKTFLITDPKCHEAKLQPDAPVEIRLPPSLKRLFKPPAQPLPAHVARLPKSIIKSPPGRGVWLFQLDPPVTPGCHTQLGGAGFLVPPNTILPEPCPGQEWVNLGAWDELRKLTIDELQKLGFRGAFKSINLQYPFTTLG